MLEFSQSVLSVFLDKSEKTPTVKEISDILKRGPFEVVNIDYSTEDFGIGEKWSFSATFDFEGERKTFSFALKYINRTLEDYFMDNDIYNYYIMTPKKIYDKWWFRDLWIVADITEDEAEGYHKMLKVVSLFSDHSMYFRDNASYSIKPIEYACYWAKNKTSPSYRDLFHIQQFLSRTKDWNKVWIHTHGLERLWYSEIEVLDVDDYTSKIFYGIVESLAYCVLENWEPEEIDNFDIWNGFHCSLIPSIKVIPNFWKMTLWGFSDRISHGRISTNVLTFVKKYPFWIVKYINPKEYISLFLDTPFVYKYSEEEERLYDISKEKIAYFLDAYERKRAWDKTIKMAIRTEDDEWSVERIDKDKVCIINTEWEEKKYSLTDIKRWFIGNEQRLYDADTLYLLDLDSLNQKKVC